MGHGGGGVLVCGRSLVALRVFVESVHQLPRVLWLVWGSLFFGCVSSPFVHAASHGGCCFPPFFEVAGCILPKEGVSRSSLSFGFGLVSSTDGRTDGPEQIFPDQMRSDKKYLFIFSVSSSLFFSRGAQRTTSVLDCIGRRTNQSINQSIPRACSASWFRRPWSSMRAGT